MQAENHTIKKNYRMNNTETAPEYVFESSWEVCNKMIQVFLQIGSSMLNQQMAFM